MDPDPFNRDQSENAIEYKMLKLKEGSIRPVFFSMVAQNKVILLSRKDVILIDQKQLDFVVWKCFQKVYWKYKK